MEKGNFFVRRPIVAMVIAIVIVIVGIVSLLGLPMEQYPNITPPVVEVRGTYTGANAINVEQSVATPIEQEMNGVENMIYMKSINSNDGIMNLQISFEVGSDPDMSTVFAQNRVSAATAKLPEDVKKFGVTTKKTLPNIMLLVTITSDGRYDQDFLGNYALINIKDVLARIKGIGNVNVLGASDYSMRIWVKPDRLAHLGITIGEIRQAIAEQNIIVPGGKFGAEPAPEGTEFTYTVRMPERLQTPEEFGNIIVRTNEDGSQVRIADIANVELGVETYLAYTRLDREDCAIIAIYQMPGSNAVELQEKVLTTMEELKADFPEGIDYTVSLDTTKPITAGIREIVTTLLIAIVLVVLVVFIFIQDVRATLIPTLAIPVSLVGAFTLFPMLGFTVNTLSLLGLVLAIGIVVDDAIVVVEAVQVKIGEGLTPKQATIAAMKEVTAPVIATTLVLVAVFVPVASMGGITGRLYQQFAITIAVSVVFSSLNALTLSPALCSLILRKPRPVKGLLGKFFTGFNRTFDRASTGYLKFTNVVARKIQRGVIFILVLSGSILLVSKFIPGGFIPEEDMGYFMVNIQLPDAASIQRSDVIARQVEDILFAHEEYIRYVTTATGFSLLSNSMAPNAGFLFVTTTDWDERDRTVTEIVQELNREFRQKINGAAVFAFGPPAIPGLGNGSGFTMMLQDRLGNTPAYLSAEAAKFIAAAQERPEIGSIFTTYRSNVPQRYLDIDIDKALKLGVSLGDLYTTVGAFLGGAYVSDFNRFGRLYKAFIQAEPEYRLNADKMNLFFVRNKNGENVPLSTMITVRESSGPDYTVRFNLLRSVELTGQPAAGYSSADALNALEEVAAEVLPQGVGYAWANMSYQEKMAGGAGSIVFVFALVFVFLILAAQYESWSLPFSILLGTPFAIFGAMLFIAIFRIFSTSFENNVFMQISLVMLIAMAAKNAILIVEFANLEFEKGLALYDAAIKAAKLRFRPILMTAFSFILGIFPLIVASGAGAEARKVMGVALLGGMLIATLLGVFFYPMLFIMIGRIARYEQKRERLPAQEQTSKNPES
jgi:HAE1 family hydrophobic/amphiphilic exporter-1